MDLFWIFHDMSSLYLDIWWFRSKTQNLCWCHWLGMLQIKWMLSQTVGQTRHRQQERCLSADLRSMFHLVQVRLLRGAHSWGELRIILFISSPCGHSFIISPWYPSVGLLLSMCSYVIMCPTLHCITPPHFILQSVGCIGRSFLVQTRTVILLLLTSQHSVVSCSCFSSKDHINKSEWQPLLEVSNHFYSLQTLVAKNFVLLKCARNDWTCLNKCLRKIVNFSTLLQCKVYNNELNSFPRRFW